MASKCPPPWAWKPGQAFIWTDRRLNLAPGGLKRLRHEAIADLFVESLHKGAELGHYELGSFAAVAHHVLALLRPEGPPSRLLQWIEGHAAREANRMLGRTGEAFWQPAPAVDPKSWSPLGVRLDGTTG